jgi:hypothetical protein
MTQKRKKLDSPRTQINKAKMLKHLKMNLGNVRKAVDTSGVKKSTFYDWLKKDPDYQQAVLNIYRGGERFAIDSIMDTIGDDVDELIKAQKRNFKRIRILGK